MSESRESKRAVLTEEFICSALVNSRQERINALMNKENNNKHVNMMICIFFANYVLNKTKG